MWGIILKCLKSCILHLVIRQECDGVVSQSKLCLKGLLKPYKAVFQVLWVPGNLPFSLRAVTDPVISSFLPCEERPLCEDGWCHTKPIRSWGSAHLSFLTWKWHANSQCCTSEATQSCPTLCDPMDCSPTGSSVRGIFQARVLEWVAISFSRGSSQPRDWTQVSCIAGRRFTVWATWEAK